MGLPLFAHVPERPTIFDPLLFLCAFSLVHPFRPTTVQAEEAAAAVRSVCEEQSSVIAELERAVAAAQEDAAAVAAAGAEWRRQQLSVDQVWADNARLAALLHHGPHYQALLQGAPPQDRPAQGGTRCGESGCNTLGGKPSRSGHSLSGSSVAILQVVESESGIE